MKHVLLFLFVLCIASPLMGQTRPAEPNRQATEYTVPDGKFVFQDNALIFRGDTLYFKENLSKVDVIALYTRDGKDTEAIVDYRSKEGIYIEVVENRRRLQVVIPKH